MMQDAGNVLSYFLDQNITLDSYLEAVLFFFFILRREFLTNGFQGFLKVKQTPLFHVVVCLSGRQILNNLFQ